VDRNDALNELEVPQVSSHEHGSQLTGGGGDQKIIGEAALGEAAVVATKLPQASIDARR